MPQARQTSCCQQTATFAWLLFVYGMCLYDFGTDLATAIAFCHSPVGAVHTIGYIAACVLGLSCLVNVIMVTIHQDTHEELYDVHLKQVRPMFLHTLITLAAWTNSEIMGMEIAFFKARLSEVGAGLAGMAEKSIQSMAFVSQIFEDGPQLSLQVAGIVILHSIGKPVPLVSLLSVGQGTLMLFLKASQNCLINILRVEAPADFLKVIATREGRRVDDCGNEDMLCALFLQVLLLIATIAYTAAIQVKDTGEYWYLPGFIAAWWAITLFTGFTTCACVLAADRTLYWHLQLHPTAAVAIPFMSTLSPTMLEVVSVKDHPAPGHALMSHSALGFAVVLCGTSLLRAAGLFCASVWALWQDPFPVPDKVGTAYVVLSAASGAYLIKELARVVRVTRRRIESYRALDSQGILRLDFIGKSWQKVEGEIKSLGDLRLDEQRFEAMCVAAVSRDGFHVIDDDFDSKDFQLGNTSLRGTAVLLWVISCLLLLGMICVVASVATGLESIWPMYTGLGLQPDLLMLGLAVGFCYLACFAYNFFFDGNVCDSCEETIAYGSLTTLAALMVLFSLFPLPYRIMHGHW